MIDKRFILFQRIWELKSFSLAASFLGMSQPNATQQIQRLEKDLNLKLFERDTHTLKLTTAGEILFKELSTLVIVSNGIKQKLLSSKSKVTNYLLGGTQSIGNYLLPLLIARYMSNHPQSILNMKIGNTVHITEQVATGVLDVALIEGPFDRDNFIYELYGHDKLVATGGSYFFDQTDFSLQKYISQGGCLILREPGSGTRYHFDLFCKENKIEIPASQIMVVESFEAIKILIEHNVGISYISEKVCRKELQNNILVQKNMLEGEILREFNFIYSSNADMNFVRSFIQFCMKMKNIEYL